MKKIKFRGKTHDGKIIHSDSIKFEEIDGADVSFPYLLDKENDEWIEILPDSLARFIAYDADGNEIYEGDKCVDEYGDRLFGGNPRLAVVDEDGNFLGDIGDSFEDISLKE